MLVHFDADDTKLKDCKKTMPMMVIVSRIAVNCGEKFYLCFMWWFGFLGTVYDL